MALSKFIWVLFSRLQIRGLDSIEGVGLIDFIISKDLFENRIKDGAGLPNSLS